MDGPVVHGPRSTAPWDHFQKCGPFAPKGLGSWSQRYRSTQKTKTVRMRPLGPRSGDVPTLCDPKDCSPPGSSVHGMISARTPERLGTSSSRSIFLTQISNPCFLHLLWQAEPLPLSYLGRPHVYVIAIITAINNMPSAFSAKDANSARGG